MVTQKAQCARAEYHVDGKTSVKDDRLQYLDDLDCVGLAKFPKSHQWEPEIRSMGRARTGLYANTMDQGDSREAEYRLQRPFEIAVCSPPALAHE